MGISKNRKIFKVVYELLFKAHHRTTIKNQNKINDLWMFYVRAAQLIEFLIAITIMDATIT